MRRRLQDPDFALQCFQWVVGTIVLFLGLTVMFGWYTSNLALVRILPSSVVMKVNTALGLSICGAAILSVRQKWSAIAFAGGFTGCLLGSLTLLEHLFKIDLGIDQMVQADYLSGQVVFPGRMALASALEFLLIGSALLVLSSPSALGRRPLVAGILGAVSTAIAAAAFAEYIVGTTSAAAANGLVKMAVHTSGGFVLLGLGIVACAWREHRRIDSVKTEENKGFLPPFLLSPWLGGALAVTILLLSLAIWRSLLLTQNALITRTIVAETDTVTQRINEQLQEQAQSLIRLSRQWEIYGTPSAAQWDAEAQLTLHDFSGFRTLSFVDSLSHVRWIVPHAGNEKVIGYDVTQNQVRRSTFEAARARREISLSPPLELMIGGHGFFMCVPIYQQGHFAGFISGAFQSDLLFHTILHRKDTEGYSLDITDAGDNVYTHFPDHRSPSLVPGADEQQLRFWDQTRTLSLFGRDWKVTVRPTQELLMHEQSTAPEAALGLGIVMAVLVLIMTHLAQTTHRHAVKLVASNAKLADEITLRECQEVQLQLQADELRRSNGALQEFASIASHDLKEPLRKIQMFSGMLRKKAGDSLEPSSRDYLDRITGAANRMTLLIEGLLDYSRISSKEPTAIRVDLNEITQEVISDLEVRIADVGGRVVAGPLPILQGDPLQMRQLLQNLLSNALKFHRDDVPPCVEISSQRFHGSRQPTVRITVTDNGIGFAPEYAERIFGVFERLESASRYEGSGVGLAICRKIVERHGGTICANSIQGEGTTFVIDLPER